MKWLSVVVSLLSAPLISACTLQALGVLAVATAVTSVYTVAPEQIPGPFDQVVTAGDTVALSSRTEIPADLPDVEYQWRQTGGPGVRIEVLTNHTARFVAPAVKSNKELTFHVRIEVGDGDVREDSFAILVQTDSHNM